MRGTAALAAVVVLVFVGFGVYFTLLQQRRAEESRQQAERTRAKAESYVIGSESEAVRQAEERRLARGGFGASPMPEAGYDLGEKEHGLLFPKRQAFETEIATLGRSYAEKTDEERAAIRASLSRADLYNLLHFAKRSAVFAVRANSVETCRDGFHALAMIEKDRIDWRDFLVSCGILDYATRRVAGSSDAEFLRAKALAEPKIAELLGGFNLRREPLRNLRAWNLTEHRSGADFGLLASDHREYAPQSDLTNAGLDIAQFLDIHRYDYPTLTIATRVPTVWFGTPDKDGVKSILARTTGSISISAQAEDQEPFADTLLVFVTEAASPEDSEALRKAAAGKPETRALRSGSLFCIVVSRSREGIQPFETPESLHDLHAGIQKTLDLENAKKK